MWESEQGFAAFPALFGTQSPDPAGSALLLPQHCHPWHRGDKQQIPISVTGGQGADNSQYPRGCSQGTQVIYSLGLCFVLPHLPTHIYIF